LQALEICVSQAVAPPSGAIWAGPLRHATHGLSGALGVVAHTVAAHADAQGPGADEVPQPQLMSAVTNVTYPLLSPDWESSGGWVAQQCVQLA
jgi:hypothetical protein